MDQEANVQQTGDDVAVGHHTLEKLVGNGISTGDIKKLEECGYHTGNGFQCFCHKMFWKNCLIIFEKGPNFCTTFQMLHLTP